MRGFRTSVVDLESYDLTNILIPWSWDLDFCWIVVLQQTCGRCLCSSLTPAHMRPCWEWGDFSTKVPIDTPNKFLCLTNIWPINEMMRIVRADRASTIFPDAQSALMTFKPVEQLQYKLSTLTNIWAGKPFYPLHPASGELRIRSPETLTYVKEPRPLSRAQNVEGDELPGSPLVRFHAHDAQ